MLFKEIGIITKTGTYKGPHRLPLGVQVNKLF